MNPFERILKLWFSIGKMLVDGVRDPEDFAEYLQVFVNQPAPILSRLYRTENIIVGGEEVAIYELVKSAEFAEVFGSLGSLDKLWLTSGQIDRFCRVHANKLLTNGHATFFLKRTVSNFVVVPVGICAHDYPFDDRTLWHVANRYRFVVRVS